MISTNINIIVGLLLLGFFIRTSHALSMDMISSRQSSRKAFLGQIAAASSALTIHSSAAFAAGSIPTLGAKAPDFKLPNSRGGETSLSDLTKTGKTTVLYFYPGAFTNGCSLEARNFQSDIDKYKELDAQIVGVSVDPVEKNAQFCATENLEFFMLSDYEGKVSKLYGSALSIPGFGSFSNRQTYIIDKDGNLRWVFTDVESHVPRHSTEVLEKLEELKKQVA